MIGLPDLFFRIKRYAKKINAKLLHDSVEWYSPEEYKRGKLSIEYNLKILNNTKIIKEPWNVIAISKYLENFYSDKGITTIRVPVIMDVFNVKEINKVKNDKCIFVYAGVPGRKDYLDLMIEGFSMLPQEYRNKFEFHIFGADENQLINQCGVKKQHITKLDKNLVIHGRVKREEVIKWIKKCNYTVLLRDDSLSYAKAGFPTKIVESLTYSTPVICNYSSDLKDYLIDENNAIIVQQFSPQEFCNAIIKGMKQGKDKQKEMQKNARKTAEKYFDYRAYSKKICDLLK